MDDPTTLAIAAGASPLVVLAYLLCIRWLDRYEREPLGVTLAMFALGAFGATTLSILLFELVDPLVEPLVVNFRDFHTVVEAPLIEELCKGAMFIPVMLTGFWGTSRFNLAKHLDNTTDGLIYGAAIGLGFGAAENILYFLGYASLLSQLPFLPAKFRVDIFSELIFYRTAMTALGHAASTALIGAAVGYVRHRRIRWRWLIYPGHAWVFATIEHSLWNQIGRLDTWSATQAFVHVGAVVATLIILIQLALWREQRVLRRYLVFEADRGTLPLAHARIIPRWLRRLRGDWLDEHVPRHEYVHTATLLAFRLHQRDLRDDDHDTELSSDIDHLRRKLQRLRNAEAAQSG